LLPGHLRDSWTNEFRAIARRNLWMAGNLVALVKFFDADGIPLLPHKGPLLAQAAYRDLAMREFSDLDILVHAGDLPHTLTLLAKHGYTPVSELAWLSPQALLHWTGEITCTSPHGPSVDLHWRLTPPHYPVQLDAEKLWRFATSISIAGTRIPTLAPEALLVLLAVHGAKHAWECLGWLADIAWLLESPQRPDWNRALAFANEVGCARPALLAASLLADLYAVDLPDAVRERIAHDPRIAALHRRVVARWESGTTESPGSRELLSFTAKLSTSPLKTAHHLFGLIFHPTEIDWRAKQRPESQFWLYGPARLLRLAGKHLWRTAK